MKQPESYINFEVYEDSKRYCGITQATLPDVAFIVQTIQGAGIGGNVEAVIPMLEAMTATLNFRTPTEQAINLARPVVHNIDLRIAEQVGDTTSGNVGVVADKYAMSVFPKTTKLGNVAPASPADASGEYAVRIFKAYRNGELLMDIEPYNYKCIINGVDYLAPVRKALGR